MGKVKDAFFTDEEPEYRAEMDIQETLRNDPAYTEWLDELENTDDDNLRPTEETF